MEKTLGELAHLVEGELLGDPAFKITGVAGLEEARSTEISFVVGPKYVSKAHQTEAGALIVPPKLQAFEKPLIISENPYLGFAKILKLFAQKQRPTVLGVSAKAHL
jgi:UDP-3-O-[3-hydroxymyristoyl] glucosamine N-acyltransferase